MSGYICLYRDIENHWIWLEPRRLQWWLQLLFMAAWEPTTVAFGNESVNLERGQILTTMRKLMTKWGAHSQATLSFLDVLVSQNMIRVESTKKRTLITIINYDKYQTQGAKISQNAKRQSQQKPQQISKHIEERNNEEENNLIKNPNNPPTREQNQIFFEEIRVCREFWIETAKGLFQTTTPSENEISKLKSLAESFFSERLAKSDFRDTCEEVKDYLYNWLRKALEMKKGPARNSTTTQLTSNGTTKNPGRYGYNPPTDARPNNPKSRFSRKDGDRGGGETS